MIRELSAWCNEKGRWSDETFGLNDETKGPNFETLCLHIEKELAEVRDKPQDLSEWVDIILLAMDGYYRYGGRDLGVDLDRKHYLNQCRKWPDPATREPGTPTEHIREEL